MDVRAEFNSMGTSYPKIVEMSLGTLPEVMIYCNDGEITYLNNGMRFKLCVDDRHIIFVTIDTNGKDPHYIVSDDVSSIADKENINVAAAATLKLTKMGASPLIIDVISELKYSPWMWPKVRDHLRKNRVVSTPSTQMIPHQHSISPKVISSAFRTYPSMEITWSNQLTTHVTSHEVNPGATRPANAVSTANRITPGASAPKPAVGKPAGFPQKPLMVALRCGDVVPITPHDPTRVSVAIEPRERRGCPTIHSMGSGTPNVVCCAYIDGREYYDANGMHYTCTIGDVRISVRTTVGKSGVVSFECCGKDGVWGKPSPYVEHAVSAMLPSSAIVTKFMLSPFMWPEHFEELKKIHPDITKRTPTARALIPKQNPEAPTLVDWNSGVFPVATRMDANGIMYHIANGMRYMMRPVGHAELEFETFVDVDHNVEFRVRANDVWSPRNRDVTKIVPPRLGAVPASHFVPMSWLGNREQMSAAHFPRSGLMGSIFSNEN